MARAKKDRPSVKEVWRQTGLDAELREIARLEEEGNLVAVLLPDADDEIRTYLGYIDSPDKDGGFRVGVQLTRDRFIELKVRFDDRGYAANAVRFASLLLSQKLDILHLLRAKNTYYLIWPAEPVGSDVVAYVDDQIRRLEGRDVAAEVEVL